MQSTLEDIKISNLKPAMIGQDHGMLPQYVPSMFAEALVPINIRRWLSFAAGSASASDMPEFGDKIKTPFENLVVAKEYLETSQSDIQYRDRFWKLSEDTTTINCACELGGESATFASGVLSNKIADNYMEEMIHTELTLTDQEKLNLEIFKQVAQAKGIDPNTVRGTGVAREFVPDFMQADLCDRPERNARPFDDDSGQGPLEDGIIFHSKNNDLDPSGGSVFESSSSTAENQNNFFSRCLDLFGGGSDDNMCPVNTDYASSDSPLMDKLCSLFGFFIPEGGGGYHCTDSSMMVPPSPFLADAGDFCKDP
jgi:hypothetical protein